MQEQDYKMFYDTMIIGGSLAGEKIDNLKIRAIFDFIKNLPFTIEQVAEAINNHYYTSEFPIKPANIVNYIKEKYSQKTVKTNSAAIFKQIIKKIQANSYDNLNFQCPKVHYAIQQIGGLYRLCNSQISEHVWIEKEFAKAYEEAVIRDVSWDNVPKFLPSPYPGAANTAENIFLSLEDKPKIERKALEDNQLKEMTSEQREEYAEKFKKLMNNFSVNKKQEKNFSLEVEENG